MDEKKLQALVDEINLKLEGVREGQVKSEDVESAIQKHISDLNIEGKALVEFAQELQKQTDTQAAEIKALRAQRAEKEIKSLETAILEGLEAVKETVSDYVGGGRKEFAFDLNVKTDLTSSSNLVNDTTNDIHLVPPQRSLDVVYDPERPVHMRDIMSGPFPMTGNAFTYPLESAYSDGSGLVAENTASGNTTFTLTQTSALTGTIAAHVVLSNLMLEDFPALAAYLSTRLTEKLLSAEDSEILDGTGVISGLNANATAFSAGGATVTAPTRYDVITMANKQIRTSEYRSTAIVMHPTDVALMKLEKDADEQYIMPFIFVQGGRIVVDMVPVIDNTAQTAGTYLIGDFQRGASLYQRRNITLKFHDSDDVGDVTKDMSTVTISERVAMPLFRTSAFVTDTWAASITELTP